ncbi:MAG: Wzz/FepE/Etk N-terminal domain-containing protein [Planctomycetota bacterium]
MVQAVQNEPLTESASPPRRRSGAFTVQWRNPERTLVDYVSAVWSAKFAVLAAGLLCGLAGLVYGLTKPNTYASDARLMVHGTERSGSAADAAANLLGTGRILPDQVVTAVEIIRSRVVLARVVDAIGYEAILAPYQPVRMAGERAGLVDRAIDVLHEVQQRWLVGKRIDFARYHPAVLRDTAIEVLDLSLTVIPATRGTTMMLSYRHTSPTGAEKILRAIVDESIRRYSEVVAPPEGKDWLDIKVTEAAEEEARARTALQRFADDNGTTDFSQEITTLTKSLASLIAQQRGASISVSTNEEILGRLREEIQDLDPTIREVVQEVYAADALRSNALQSLVQLRVKRAAEDAAGTPGSPLARRLDLQIKAIERELDELGPAEPARTVAVRANPKYALLDDSIRRRELELIGARTEIPMFDEAVSDLQKTLEAKREFQRDVDLLHDRLKEAEAQHKRLRQISKTYQINSELDTRGLTNLRTVEPATMPNQKEGPHRGKLLIAAVVGGLGLAVTFLLVRVRLSRKLIRHTDVSFAVGRSDVVSLPMLTPRNLERFAEARRRGWE